MNTRGSALTPARVPGSVELDRHDRDRHTVVTRRRESDATGLGNVTGARREPVSVHADAATPPRDVVMAETNSFATT
ncbi:MAG TPA: hypothetical protein VF796_29350, partial [Humisphaera sp.]